MSKKKKNLAVENVPQNHDEASAMIARLGDLRRELTLIETAMDEGVAAIKKLHKSDAEPIQEEMAALTAGVQTYCEANRKAMTQNNKVKFFQFATGSVKWRKLPAKVTLRGKDAILEALNNLGLEQFIRTKQDIDKDAMLSSPETAAKIEGVSIGSEGETFDIEPHLTKLDDAA